MAEAAAQIGLDELKPITGEENANAREARFATLVECHAQFVFRVAYSILRNASDSEDVVQETFLKLYRTGAWESINDERAFLARAAWRIAVEKLAKRSKTGKQAHLESASSDPNPEQAAIAANWNATVHMLLDSLPEELRQPLVLSTVEEMNSREIAKVLGIAEGTVRTRLMRARQILKEKLASLPGNRYAK